MSKKIESLEGQPIKKAKPEEILEDLIKKYPNLGICKKDNFYCIANVPKLKDSSLWFVDVYSLQFILRETSGLKQTTLVGIRPAVFFKNKLHVLLSSGKRYQALGRSDVKVLNFDFDGTKLQVKIGNLPLNLRRFSFRIGPSTTFDNCGHFFTDFFKEDKGEISRIRTPLSKEYSRKVWDSLITSILVGNLSKESPKHEEGSRDWHFTTRYSRYANYILEIKPLKKKDKEILQSKWETIVESIAFNIYYSTGLILDFPDISPTDMTDLRSTVIQWKTESIPDSIQYRPHDPLLVECARVAENTTYPFFRYLSFYHILEHFFNEVPIVSISQEISKTILSPKFLQNPEYYTERIVRLIGKKIPKSLQERELIEAVIHHFIPYTFVDSIPDYLREHLKESVKLEKGVEIPAVKFEMGHFLSNLSARIYDLRCAIVHSKDIAGWGKGHVVPSVDNFNIVNLESDVLKLVAQEVIAQSGPFYLRQKESSTER